VLRQPCMVLKNFDFLFLETKSFIRFAVYTSARIPDRKKFVHDQLIIETTVTKPNEINLCLKGLTECI
jgi:hypothetical protein